MSLYNWGRPAPLLARSGLMQQSMVKILYINEKEDRGSEEVHDGKRNLASLVPYCRTLAKLRMRRGNLGTRCAAAEP